MGSEIISISPYWRVEVGCDPGVPSCIGKEWGDLGGFVHLVVRRKLGQGWPFCPVLLPVVGIAS